MMKQVYLVSIQQSLTQKLAPRGAATIQTIFFTQHGFHLRYSVLAESFDSVVISFRAFRLLTKFIFYEIIKYFGKLRPLRDAFQKTKTLSSIYGL